MGCCRPNTSSRTPSPIKPSSFESTSPLENQNPESKNLKQEIFLGIPGCTVHLIDEGEALELANGELTLIRISDESVSLATIIRVGEDLQWPLTKDEPVVKLDPLHYLFSLPVRDGNPLSYGVTFWEDNGQCLGYLDSFLKENSCFSVALRSGVKEVDWEEYAPRIEDYKNFLAKAIAGGTGQLVKGIFKCSNAYTSQVQQEGNMILNQAAEQKNGATARESSSKRSSGSTKKGALNKSLKRVRKLSKMTEKMSKTMLDGLGLVSGSVMTPLVKSQAGKAFLAMVPGEVLLASLDAVNKVLDAAEAAEKQAFSATSSAATKMVTKRFGESAGEATEDVIATAGHCVGTAWNIFKIRKALNPASSVQTGVLKSTQKNKYTSY